MDRIENLDDINLSNELCLRLLLILSWSLLPVIPAPAELDVYNLETSPCNIWEEDKITWKLERWYENQDTNLSKEATFITPILS